MNDVGRDPIITKEEVFKLLYDSERPVWSPKDVAEHFGVSLPPARDRLAKLEEAGWVETLSVSNVTAYYAPETDSLASEEQQKQSLIHEYTDKFVGLETAPWTAVHPADGPGEAGEKVQLLVEGTPGNWSRRDTFAWPNRREELFDEEIDNSRTQALVSGELYAKPTAPIRHIEYPDDYELEKETGAEYTKVKDSERRVLIASGLKNYLLRPCDDAVFLSSPSIDWISLRSEDGEISGDSVDIEDVAELLEQRGQDEALDEYTGEGEPGL